jgi:hypothetical protein
MKTQSFDALPQKVGRRAAATLSKKGGKIVAPAECFTEVQTRLYRSPAMTL